MKYLVAVSGGIDSIVLLDQLTQIPGHEYIVAHFDHGIRPDSARDAQFVERLAKNYGLPFLSIRRELGPGTSEAEARQRRYEFLQEQALAHGAKLVTAHHGDDVVETIAINLSRGTGWRGLAVLDDPDIQRPLLHYSKEQLKQYAAKRELAWVEDSTNSSDEYLRNRLRRSMQEQLDEASRKKLLDLWTRQRDLKREINEELERLTGSSPYLRYRLIHMDQSVAEEFVRHVVTRQTKQSPTRPQLARAVLAIKTAKPGATFELGGGVKLRFTLREFVVETL